MGHLFRPSSGGNIAGQKWTPIATASAPNDSWKSLKYVADAGLWFAVACIPGFQGTEIATSPDGKVWTRIVPAPSNGLAFDIDYSPILGQIIIASRSNSAQFQVSTDLGVTWNTIAPLVPTATGFNSIVWAGAPINLWLAGCNTGDAANGSIATSPDGVVWTLRVDPNAAQPKRTLAFSPDLGQVVVANGNETLSYTANGIAWNSTNITAGFTVTGIAWSESLGLYAATSVTGGFTSSPFVFTSPDGINWTQRNMPVSAIWRSIAWSPSAKRFIAVNSNVSLVNGGGRFASSTDGITWVPEYGPTNDYVKVDWSDALDMFVAVSDVQPANNSEFSYSTN